MITYIFSNYICFIMNRKKLVIKQLDRELRAWKKLSPYSVPTQGWIKTIRKALDMSAEQLARRLNISRRRVVALEGAEQENGTTLRSLKQAANALNCDLVYALVPRTSLQETIEQQATKKAKSHLKPIAYSMALEEQAVTGKESREQLNEIIEALLSGSMRHLWDE
jgi:predicted DNA-binding mobile mystery protein A